MNLLNENTLKVAISQYVINNKDPEENFKKITSFIKKNDNDIVILPEMGITGYNFNKLKEILKNSNFYLEKLKFLSKENNVAICTTLPFLEKEAIYNRLFFITPNEDIFFYDKKYLINWGGFLEKNFFQNGNIVQVISYKNWLIGFAICYDLRFPELFYELNQYSLKKYGDFLKLIIIPSQWPKRRIQHFIQLSRARAIENLCYLISVNNIGVAGNLEFNGQSLVIDPDGNPILHLNEEEGIFSTEIHLKLVNQIQGERPILKDRFFVDN